MKTFAEFLTGRAAYSRLPVALLLLLLLVAVPVAATPPSAMSLSYDQSSSELSVTITHPVMNIPGHYIKYVNLTVNGNVDNDSLYTSQPADTFTYMYPLVLRPGDLVEATATCSLSGSGTATFIMPGSTATAPAGQPASPTPKESLPVITTLAGIVAVFAIRRRS